MQLKRDDSVLFGQCESDLCGGVEGVGKIGCQGKGRWKRCGFFPHCGARAGKDGEIEGNTAGVFAGCIAVDNGTGQDIDDGDFVGKGIGNKGGLAVR